MALAIDVMDLSDLGRKEPLFCKCLPKKTKVHYISNSFHKRRWSINGFPSTAMQNTLVIKLSGHKCS